VPVAQARTVHGEAWARERFATANRLREALNGRPSAERSRRDFQHVVDAYRRVYLGAPASSRADPSVVAAAELLVEMGRRFDDDEILGSAIEQYEFLRREYPGSKYRFDALFTIGEIYKDDLDDPAKARVSFEEFLHRYPRHHLAEDAERALDELAQEAARKEAEKKEAARKLAARREKIKSDKQSGDDAGDDAQAEARSRKLPRVTGIRHWSTPDYTRVAIDLEQEVKFDSQRIGHPDRIFFDLRETKLASTLVGKSFDVDDGFLKKIRVAQFQPERTRVVLEVDDLSDYNAFLLPNPYRLIIDIHGKQSGAASTGAAVAEPRGEARKEVAVADAVERQAEAPAERAKAAPAAVKTFSDLSKPKAVTESATADRNTVSKKPETVAAAAGKAAPVKKIVEASDDEPEKIATLQPADLRPDLTPAAKASSAGSAVGDAPSALSDSQTAKPVSDKKSRSKNKRKSASARDELEVREAKPTAAGDRSLIRALGLKIGRIVIDPGHGGHDTGTIGPNGLEEKDLVLEVARRLGKLLETRMGAQVIYTRQDDTFIPLETRTAIANQQRADLFISIHANSSRDPGARGVETYYLNFTSSRDALEVAARENAVSETSIYELQDLVKKIALKEKIEESREFASDVQQALHSGLASKSPAIRDRGVKKAPFIVLIGANMPSILAEISFVSNPTDERRLETAEYRQRVAESLYRGISKYVGGLSGVKVASRMAKSEGQ
jgi:N-acetylmuramoyl-L-alanine amidase